MEHHWKRKCNQAVHEQKMWLFLGSSSPDLSQVQPNRSGIFFWFKITPCTMCVKPNIEAESLENTTDWQMSSGKGGNSRIRPHSHMRPIFPTQLQPFPTLRRPKQMFRGKTQISQSCKYPRFIHLTTIQNRFCWPTSHDWMQWMCWGSGNHFIIPVQTMLCGISTWKQLCQQAHKKITNTVLF